MRPIALVLFSFSGLCAAATEKPPHTAKDFASKGVLDMRACRLFIADRQGIAISGLVKPGSMDIDLGLLQEQTADWLATMVLRAHGVPPPYSIATADALMKLPPQADAPSWTKVPAFSEPYEVPYKNADLTGILGPLRIRKDLTEVLKESKDAKGAKIAYADNHNSGDNGAWNSQGVIYYPTQFEYRSMMMTIGLSGEWTVAEMEGAKATPTSPGDVQELTPSLPFTFFFDTGGSAKPVFQPGTANLVSDPQGPFSSEWQIQGKPYLNTDFSFAHQIYGISASANYVGGVFGSPVYLGKFQNFSKGPSGSWLVDSKLRYQITLTPTLDYSTVEDAGPHTTRLKGDNWTRLGGLAGLDIAFGGEKTPFTFGTSYQFFDTVGGTGGYSYLWKSSLTWWFSEYAGISLEHQVGETPIATEDIEQTTIGFEFKY